MNQGKLHVIKQEVARVNINILRISELKWTGIGDFNSDDHLYLLLWARIPWKKWSSPHSQQRVQNAIHGCSKHVVSKTTK